MNREVKPQENRNMPGHWIEADAKERGDIIVQAMAEGGVDHLFFTSGSDIMFYQESIARAEELGLRAPKLISVAHELTSMSAAIGYCQASGKPAATAAHVDVGTQAYGAGIHNASRGEVPVLITAGCPPTAYPGTMRGDRDGGHFWTQQTYDQNGIVRQYMKWDHRLDYQDNPGVVISRALQMAQTAPQGPVYLSLPREIPMMDAAETKYPTASQLGIAAEPAPDPDALEQLAQALVAARKPMMVVSRSGRDAATVGDLVALCETLGMAVVEGNFQAYLCMPMTHPLYLGKAGLAEADVVFALDAGGVAWIPGPNAPNSDAEIFVASPDPAVSWIPTLELHATRRITAGAGVTLRLLRERVEAIITAEQRARGTERLQDYRRAKAERTERLTAEAFACSTSKPIDVRWASYCIGEVLDENCLLMDTTITTPLLPYLKLTRPGSFIHNPSTAGGWGSGAAFGAKLAQPDRDVVLTTGDGFYMYDVPSVALSAARRYGAPYMAIIIQNSSYNTGTEEVDRYYRGGYAAKAGYEGGYLDPTVDFAREAAAAGAFGRNVDDPASLMSALREGLQQIRQGVPAVIAIRVPKLAT
jgi:acetolactate synthase-1/2/3 large subunit